MRKEDPEREARRDEVTETQQREGQGTVPNVTEDETADKRGKLKEALHDFEEEKGDWSKSRG